MSTTKVGMGERNSYLSLPFSSPIRQERVELSVLLFVRELSESHVVRMGPTKYFVLLQFTIVGVCKVGTLRLPSVCLCVACQICCRLQCRGGEVSHDDAGPMLLLNFR